MPYLVRDRLFLGGIRDALEVLQRGSNEITHVLSLLSSVSLGDLRPPVSVRTEEIRTVYMDGDDGARRVRYTVERAGTELEQVRMAVAMADEENEDLLENLELCLDFIDDGRKEGAVLVHCFAGISRSASVMTAYLMRSERLSLEDALESLRQSCEVVCPNDGFLDQVRCAIWYFDLGDNSRKWEHLHLVFGLNPLQHLFYTWRKAPKSVGAHHVVFVKSNLSIGFYPRH